jgi:hypothetical protein
VVQEYILSLGNRRATLETVGGKGASLAQLLRAGMPVPGGFHVTTAAYERFVAENNLKRIIRAALENVDASKADTLTSASEQIRDLFLRADLSEEVSGAISEAYAGLEQVDAVVAVRLSATTEDLPSASFAGQQTTSLNVRGEDELLEAVRRCWASLWSARHSLSGAPGLPPRPGRHGSGGPAARTRGGVRHLVHCQPCVRGARRDSRQRGLWSRGSARRRPDHPRQLHAGS